jgi:hypothetical protein
MPRYRHLRPLAYMPLTYRYWQDQVDNAPYNPTNLQAICLNRLHVVVQYENGVCSLRPCYTSPDCLCFGLRISKDHIRDFFVVKTWFEQLKTLRAFQFEFAGRKIRAYKEKLLYFQKIV